jgi:DNA-directed RNA polymerase subunit H (RpoH/RPB5)
MIPHIVLRNRHSNGKIVEVVRKTGSGNRDKVRNMSRKITFMEAKHNGVPRHE